MKAERLIEDLCRRYGADREHGQRLLPLVRWAQQAPQEVRKRILDLVKHNLRRSGERRVEHADEVTLRGVARVLHGWSVGNGILDLGGSDSLGEA